MTPFDPGQGVQSVYNYWLGLIPQFLGQFGIPTAGGNAGTDTPAAALNGLMFPADQVAKAAAMTQQSLQSLGQSIAPMLQSGGDPAAMNAWASAFPWMYGMQAPPPPGGSVMSNAQAAMAPWTALTSRLAAPSSSSASGSVLPLQALNQLWIDFGSRLAGTTSADLTTAFDRTYGALSHALGLGPLRQLNAAWQDVASASLAQQEARANYAVLVQSAFAQGLEGLLRRLAEKASAGERVDSIFALLKLWALSTEEAVHETLQSDAGLAATASLARSALSYRKKMQHVSAIVADMLDMATRRELDEAYREIQALKREVRAMRHQRGDAHAPEQQGQRKKGKAKRGHEGAK